VSSFLGDERLCQGSKATLKDATCCLFIFYLVSHLSMASCGQYPLPFRDRKRLSGQMHLRSQQQHDQHACHRHLPLSCSPHPGCRFSHGDPFRPRAARRCPANQVLVFVFLLLRVSFSDCHSLDHRRQERVYGNVTAVGPFKSGAGGKICLVPSSTGFSSSHWDMRGTQTETTILWSCGPGAWLL